MGVERRSVWLVGGEEFNRARSNFCLKVVKESGAPAQIVRALARVSNVPYLWQQSDIIRDTV